VRLFLLIDILGLLPTGRSVAVVETGISKPRLAGLGAHVEMYGGEARGDSHSTYVCRYAIDI